MVDGVLKLGHFDNFDADMLASLVFDTLVDGAAISFADMLVDLVGVAFNSFHHR